MSVTAPTERSLRPELRWELRFPHALYERQQDPVYNVDSSTGWIPGYLI